MFSSIPPINALTGVTTAVLIVAYIAFGSLLTLVTKLADVTSSLGNDDTLQAYTSSTTH